MSLSSLLGTGSYTVALALVVGLGVSLIVLSRLRREDLPLPPGPPGEPILGHLRIIPTDNPEYAYIKWSEEYKSDILSFNVLGQPIVVLNSVRSAVDLLDKRGGNYCDRPKFVLFNIMGFRKTLTFLGWGPAFKLHRRILQRSFQKSNITQYHFIQQREAALMVQSILAKPDAWNTAIRRFSTAVILEIAFGITVEYDDDPWIQLTTHASYAIAHSGAPGGTPVDFFPFLRYLPSYFHDRSLKFAQKWRWAISDLHDKPFTAVLRSAEVKPSLIRNLLDQRRRQINNKEQPELSDEDIQGAAGVVFAAGQDTTWATLTVFILNMLLHPDIQVKAQSLLDTVVGRNRLPTFEDRPQLLYIDYIVQETLRWCPVSPIGVPHKSLEDDVYNGMRIPAGSLVFANARAMTHDKQTYTNPDDFNPDRYAPVEMGGLGEPFPNGQFGYGRRICVGMHLAEASVWIVAAAILSTMSIQKAVDESGNEITPEVELTNGLTSHPKPYQCRFVARDEVSAQVIRGATV
ncbi:hypothetical protein QQS21_006098 [Conoideocrella luteorostrata]|uniref:Cytochrome P450 n=1 Tax=Conoideocrella luteorostrata TaxID=1105319 RepID=A0AAJ0CN96_9HYPO|nr:hypothetical protein QQS21_006098 [Conoideocrella luteorostrata]